MSKNRFTKKDWITSGFNALREKGASALTIDELCARANKTRGSFYFHFSSIDEYLEALVKAWQETYTTQITTTPAPNTKRLDLLNQLVTRLDLELESGIRTLAARSAQIKHIITQADEARTEWLAKLYVNTGSYNKSEAAALARIEIAAFTGFRLINPNMKPAEARQFYDSFLKFTNRA